VKVLTTDQKYTEHTIGRYQAGFRTGKPTIDQILQLKIYWEKHLSIMWRYNRFLLNFRKHMTASEEKLYAIMVYLGIPNKLIRLTKATMVNSTYHVKLGTNMTEGFKVGTGLKQGDRLAPNLFNIALKYVIRKLSIRNTSIIFHKTMKLIIYAGDTNIIGRTKRAISELYEELKERANEVGLIINVDNTKAMVQSRRPAKGRTVTVGDHNIEMVRRFKYSGIK
jgi:hypothetical protein